MLIDIEVAHGVITKHMDHWQKSSEFSMDSNGSNDEDNKRFAKAMDLKWSKLIEENISTVITSVATIT